MSNKPLDFMPTKINKIDYQLLILLGFIAIFISCKKEQIQVKTIKSETVEINDNINSDSSISDFVKPYHEKLTEKVSEIIGYNDQILSNEEVNLQSTLGNAYADICLNFALPKFKEQTGRKIDFALFNYGGLRQSVYKGPIKVEDIFELMPFENMLVIAEMSGEQVQSLFDYFEKNKKAHPISGVNLTFEGEKLSEILIDGKKFSKTENYLVLTNDYLQKGGDNMIFFKDPIKLYSLDAKIRDVIISEIKLKDTIKGAIDDRIKMIN
ncbi:5'-nucleotidase C-terminal domain-containing protein [Namhaeicola litoreus]|uniref:5'-nucleotidase C-terminal domain-containing protein n=1 Tax=Namhaeicola litoreus TaxID=1052145 RepID=A0ABW3Y669_9FLAO